MYLKSLKLAGFKSFADRTKLEYRPGVTVIVGPNGSGKSNVVDALSWVLGTQSTKSLRTSKMEDVIFSGTATRPALGRAEVTLVVDNAERRIDLDLDEVSITRRLYRDGSSDYELNGVACRLLDIQDLLSDAGVGRHQHVIIGQGEIGRVLNASPEDHRAVIEEAAGILKHRRRKERSERRLERTDEDLVRLEDLLGEIKRQMRPLRRQAKAAATYGDLKAEVVSLRLYLGGKALEEHDRQLTILTSEKSRLFELRDVDVDRLGKLDARLQQLTQSVGAVGADLDRDTSAAAVLETTTERLRRISSVSLERARALSGRKEARDERIGDIADEMTEIESELEAIAANVDSARNEAATAERRFRAVEDEERSVTAQSSLSPEGALAAVRGELSALEATMTRDQREEKSLVHRLEVLSSQQLEEAGSVDRLNEEIKAQDDSLSVLQAEYEAAVNARQADQHRWESAEVELAEARTAVAASEARREAVEAALAGRHDADARRIAESADGALGSLTSLLEIPDGLERAVEAALGPWVDAVGFDGPESLEQAARAVKGSGGGSVSIVDVSKPGRGELGDLVRQVGVDALLDKLESSSGQSLAKRLLGDVVLVEGWQTAWSIVSQHPELRAVTPEGDLITATGIHMANPDGAGPAMLESAEVAVEQSRLELSRAESIHTASRRDFEKSREAERAALEHVERVEAEMAGRSEAMNRLQQGIDSAAEEHGRLEVRRSALGEALAASKRQSDELRQRLQALEGEEAERARLWEQLEADRIRLGAEKELARSEWQDAASQHRAVEERRSLLIDRKARITEELERLHQGSPDSEGDPDVLANVGATAQEAVTKLELRISELRGRQARLRAAKAEVVEELESVKMEHDEIQLRLDGARDRGAEIDIRLTELRLHREAVVEAIRRDADSDAESAMGRPRPEGIPDDADLDGLLESKVAQLSRLGPINPLAAEEFGELEERHDFLAAQMADVEQSRAELRKVISALEAEIETRFQEAFEEVAQAYQRYFELLFPGGRGRIRLTDPDDPHSGVEIDAQPIGKKVSAMTLLSGGERSLAALAFLFAIFEARPSPFYVLDEVEAALDDANLRRFLRIVDEFRQRAQLLIVTHQQQTMEAADVLYGVTMEPGGSSQAIRKDMAAAAAGSESISDQVA